MRRAWLAILVLCVVMLTPAAVGAEEPAVAVEAVAGFDGRAKSGNWVPVVLTLTNSGADFSGEIFFASSVEMGPMKSTGEYRTPVLLPAGATKRVTVLVPTEMTGFPELRLMQGERTVASVRPAVEMTRDVLLGVLGVEPAELPGLGGLTVNGQAVRLVRLTPDLLPLDGLALESLDAILLDRFTYSELPEPQRLALQGWVEHGGTLIGAGGPEGRRLEGLAPWVPLSLQSAEQIAVPGVGTAPLMAADFAGWQVTRRSGDTVLAARLRKGGGQVHYLAFDPALEPFASWAGLGQFFSAILPAPDQQMEGMPMRGGMPNPIMNLANALAQHPVKEIPSARRLLIFLALYALVIGPVHLIALRAFRRTGWALLTLPLLAVAGAGGSWLYMKRIGASDVMVTMVTVMEGQQGASTLRTRTVAGVTMPPGSAASFALGDALLTTAPAPAVGPVFPDEKGQFPESKTELAQGRTAVMKPRDSWGMQAVGARAIVPGGGAVDGNLLINGTEAKGTLTSRLSFPLKDAVLVLNGATQILGDLKPGDSAGINMLVPSVVQDMRVMKMGAGPFAIIEAINRQVQPGNWGPEGPSPEQYELMRRQQMTWASLSSVDWLSGGAAPPAVLVGWTDYQPLPARVAGKPVTGSHMSVYLQPVEIRFGEGDFQIPMGFVTPRVVSWGGPGPSSQVLMPGWSMPKDATTVVEFTLPPGIGERTDEIELFVSQLRGDLSPNPLVLSVHNFATGAWQERANDRGRVAITGARPYVGPEGQVRLRIRNTSAEHFPLGVPAISVSGKGAR